MGAQNDTVARLGNSKATLHSCPRPTGKYADPAKPTRNGTSFGKIARFVHNIYPTNQLPQKPEPPIVPVESSRRSGPWTNGSRRFGKSRCTSSYVVREKTSETNRKSTVLPPPSTGHVELTFTPRSPPPIPPCTLLVHHDKVVSGVMTASEYMNYTNYENLHAVRLRRGKGISLAYRGGGFEPYPS